MSFVFSNFAEAQLQEPLEIAGTSVVINASAAEEFAQPTGSEVQRCYLLDASGNYEFVDLEDNPLTGVLTIARAKEGTPARAWPAGAKIRGVFSAEILESINGALSESEAYASAAFASATAAAVSEAQSLVWRNQSQSASADAESAAAAAAVSEGVAASAATSATTSAGTATTAAAAAEVSRSAAVSAQTSAESSEAAAALSEIAAAASEFTATTAAGTATSAASAAASSESNAETYADAASASATASQSERLAAEAASAAAEDAETAAVGARAAAETARDGAVSAQTTAETAAAAASLSETASAESATTAGTHASAAASSVLEAETYADESSASASASASSATEAAGSAGSASSSASTAAGHSSTASGYASSAESWSNLSAQFSGKSAGSPVKNPAFNQYPESANLPVSWLDQVNGTGSRVPGKIGAYAHRLVGGAGADAYMVQAPVWAATGPWFLEASAELVSGSYLGAGVYVNCYNAAYEYLNSFYLVLGTAPDTAGDVSQSKTGLRHWKPDQVLFPAGTLYVHLYAMSHFSGLGSNANANSIDWHFVDLRPKANADLQAATARAEIATEASVRATETGALADQYNALEAAFSDGTTGIAASVEQAETAAANADGSASAALSAKVAAESAQLAAENAEDEATTQATAAAGYAASASGFSDAAGASASAALGSQTAAATSASGAAGSATTASGHAADAGASSASAATYAGQASTSASDAAGSAATASSEAGLAATSESAAAGSAAASASSASTATTQAGIASTAATAATSERVAAESARDGSESAATASASSASSASTSQSASAASASAASGSATDAATYAGQANTYQSQAASARDDAQAAAITAGTHASGAAGSASTATAQASAASASAAAASSSAGLAASVGGGALNRNPVFAQYETTSGVPTGWSDWDAGWISTRQSGEAGSYGLDIAMVHNGNYGIQQTGLVHAPGWYVLEFDAWVQSGHFGGAGVYLAGAAEGLRIDCAVDSSLDGTIGVGGPSIRRWRKLVYCANGEAKNIYCMANWDGMTSPSQKTIRIYRCAVRVASQAEVEARQAKTDLVTANASIATNASAIATEAASRASEDTSIRAEFASADSGLQGQINGKVSQASYDSQIATLASADAAQTTATETLRAASMGPAQNLIKYPSGTSNGASASLTTTQQGWQWYGGQVGSGWDNGYWDPAGGPILVEQFFDGYSATGTDYRVFYLDVPVSFQGWYTFAFNGYVTNFDASKVIFYIEALNSGGSWLAGSGNDNFLGTGPYLQSNRKSVSVNAPSGTTTIRIVFRIDPQTIAPGTYCDIVVRALQLEVGQVATRFTDNGRVAAQDARLAAAQADILTQASTLATVSGAQAAFETSATASIGSLSSSVSSQGTALAGLEAAAAIFETIVAASGGDLAAVRLRAGAGGSFIELISTVLRLANISNGDVIEIMRATGGEAYFSRPISSDASGRRLTVGPGYGVSGQEVVLWFGPDTTAPSAQSRTNGYFSLGTDGKVYYGGGELATGVKFEATVSPTTVSASRSGAGYLATPNVTCNVTGGTAPYSFRWELAQNITGSGMNVIGVNDQTTAFDKTLALAEVVASYWRCIVRDSSGRITFAEVYAGLEENT